MNVVFLDIEGVLNDESFFDQQNIDWRLYNIIILNNKLNNLNYILGIKKSELDLGKIFLLKNIIDLTESKVVIISSWLNTKWYILIEEYLTSLGIPIIGNINPDLTGERGIGIIEYLKTHDVTNYIILDDEIFSTYDEELKTHLIHTNFFGMRLTDEHVNEAIYRLRNNK